MYLIAGLGNPDKKYDCTRHNIGFDTVDIFASKQGISLNKLKFKAVYGDGTVGGEKVIIAKPQTYMNNSGESIREIASFYKIAPENIIIIHDDISLEPGRIRIRPQGSDGGHNGLKSIIYHLNSDKFIRIKMGVGSPPNKDYDLADFVLGRFLKEEIPIMDDEIKRVSSAVECIIKDGVSKAMNMYNGK